MMSAPDLIIKPERTIYGNNDGIIIPEAYSSPFFIPCTQYVGQSSKTIRKINAAKNADIVLAL